jgi:hypothetical protein
MVAPVRFSFGFGSCPLPHKPFAQGGLTFPDVREDRVKVEIEFRR